jgi:solute:Na+ symporter, SSS family
LASGWAIGKRYSFLTQIQYFRDRFESNAIGYLLFPILVGLVIPYLLIGVMSSGAVISAITQGAFQNHFAEYDYGVPPWLGSIDKRNPSEGGSSSAPSAPFFLR